MLTLGAVVITISGLCFVIIALITCHYGLNTANGQFVYHMTWLLKLKTSDRSLHSLDKDFETVRLYRCLRNMNPGWGLTGVKL